MAFTPRTMSAYAPWNCSGLPRSRKLSFFRGVGQPHQFFLQALQHDGHVVDGLLHLFVIALVGLGDQFVDLAVGDLRQDAIAFANRQQNRVQHGVDALHHLAMDAFKLFRPGALAQPPFLRGLRLIE